MFKVSGSLVCQKRDDGRRRERDTCTETETEREREKYKRRGERECVGF